MQKSSADHVHATLLFYFSGDTSAFSQPVKGTLGLNIRCRLSFQSRVGPVEWLRPYTDDVLREMGQKEKVENLIVVPVSFVSEHIETLEEIDIEYRCVFGLFSLTVCDDVLIIGYWDRELAEEAGIHNWQRASALNTYDK
jgi:protoporphyrin/coproporphyrin ferrochelatase